jgi:hypothetical protein
MKPSCVAITGLGLVSRGCRPLKAFYAWGRWHSAIEGRLIGEDENDITVPYGLADLAWSLLMC